MRSSDPANGEIEFFEKAPGELAREIHGWPEDTAAP
jgi:hypothetical protein